MDNLSRAYYEVVFERDFLKKKGNPFQDLFSEIMEKNHPADFIRVRPWGSVGDRKNDGYLRSQRMLFQVYAPNEMSAVAAVAKIDEDFKGALPYWQAHFDTWVFVHNSRDGLGPDVTAKLLELQATSGGVQLLAWGFEELRQRVFLLSDADVASLLGPAPSRSNMMQLGFEDLKVVLISIGREKPAALQDVRAVPQGKLAANALSENVSVLLQAGMSRANLVGDFFQKWHEPRFGDEVVESFRKKYLELRDNHLAPDEIYYQLQKFAGGADRGQPDHEAAVLAVLAFLFEQCDIFERPADQP